MILVLPILYLVAMYLLEEIPFNPKWCLILIAIGGVYDLIRKRTSRTVYNNCFFTELENDEK